MVWNAKMANFAKIATDKLHRKLMEYLGCDIDDKTNSLLKVLAASFNVTMPMGKMCYVKLQGKG